MLYYSLYIFAIIGVLILISAGSVKDKGMAKFLMLTGGILLALSLVFDRWMQSNFKRYAY